MAEENSMTVREQAAARSKKTPRSLVWKHFTRYTDGDGKRKAECKCCRQVLAAESGTSTLWKHVKVCKKRRESGDGAPGNSHPASSVPQRVLRAPSGSDLVDPDAPSGNEPDDRREEEDSADDLARMIALHGYDPSVVDDDFFRRFVRHLNPEFKVPSRHAIEEMCDAIFDETRKDVFSRLRRAPGRPSVAVGTVSTGIEGEFEVLYTSCHFIDEDWNLHRVIMDAYANLPFPDYHGPLLGVHGVSLHDPGLHERSIDKVLEDLSERDVLDNLVMMLWDTTKDDIHHELRKQIEEKRLSIVNTILICTTFIDNLIHSIARCFIVSVNFTDDMVSDLEDLDLPRQKRQHLLSQLGLDNNLWAYDEHWYSSYCSLEVLRTEGSILADTESEFAELLCRLCGEIYRAIQRISGSSGPTSNLCLLELFNLRECFQRELSPATGDNAMAYKLTSGFLGHDQGEDVADVLREAIKMLDKAIKDSYLVWSIPVVLDPRYKLWHIDSLFKISFGSEASRYTSNVIKKIKEIYCGYIQTNDGANGGDSNGGIVMTPDSADLLEQPARMEVEHFHAQHGFSLELYNYRQAEKELDRYFDDPPVPMTAEGFDILNWWKLHTSVYPRVAQMARDALAMPTCSKLSSEQTSHIRSIVRGYSKKGFTFGVQQFW